MLCTFLYVFFFFNDTATTEIYTLSLHDALPISLLGAAEHALEHVHGLSLLGASRARRSRSREVGEAGSGPYRCVRPLSDRKSTRLNSSHANISYAVFCLKKKKNITLHH